MDPDARRALTFIAAGQLFALTLWFSASAVAPQLQDEWHLSAGQTAGLTLAVQIGFVVGAMGLAILNVPDIVPSRRLFVIAALAGATANAILVTLDGSQFPLALSLRFLTGA
ncbi:MAG: MFS transporter, partial [Acidimicrobiia bacterium]